MIHDDSNYKFFGSIFFTSSQNVCEDQFVGTISYNNQFNYNNNSIFRLQRKSAISIGTYQQRNNICYTNFNKGTNDILVIVLESPHVSEFGIIGQNFKTAPAWGNTGNKFNTQFINLLNRHTSLFNCHNGKQYDIYLINAIRYQTSLGITPICTGIRDYIFQYMWTNLQFNQDFLDRINIINPNIIINAVTKNLKPLIANELLKVNASITVLEASKHPSCWDKNTQLK